MRRKFFNKLSIIYICLIALFTLSSYIFDQGVIRQEDNLRKSEIKLDNYESKIFDIESLSSQLSSINDYLIDSIVNLSRKKNFWIKNLLLLDKNSEFRDDKMIKGINEYEYTIEKIKKQTISHYFQIIKTSWNVRDRYEYIHLWSPEYFKQYFDSNEKYIDGNLNINFDEIFDKNKDLLHVKNYKFYEINNVIEEYLNFDLNNWQDIYKITHFYLINLNSFYEKIYSDNLNIDSQLVFYETKLSEELLNNRKIISIKNSFILLSITSQILSLLFLLLFFKNLIRIKI